MENSDFFIAMFLAIGLGFGVMAIWARIVMRLEEKAAAKRRRERRAASPSPAVTPTSVADLDRVIAALTTKRERLAALSPGAEQGA